MRGSKIRRKKRRKVRIRRPLSDDFLSMRDNREELNAIDKIGRQITRIR
jgi:hypothetical protein